MIFPPPNLYLIWGTARGGHEPPSGVPAASAADRPEAGGGFACRRSARPPSPLPAQSGRRPRRPLYCYPCAQRSDSGAAAGQGSRHGNYRLTSGRVHPAAQAAVAWSRYWAAFHRKASFLAKSWRFTPSDIVMPSFRINSLASTTGQSLALSSQPVGAQSITRLYRMTGQP